MDKEEAYKKFIEAKIYLQERDGACNYANDLRRKYPEYIGWLDFSSIFRRVVNYRVKKYGTSRIGYSAWDIPTKSQKIRYIKNKQQNQRRWKNVN